MTCFTKRCCRYLFGCNFTNLYKSKCGLSYLNGVLGDNTIRSSYHRFAFDGIFLTSRRNQCSRVLGNACKPSTTTSSRIEVAYPNNSGILVSPNSAYVSYHFNTVTSRQAHTGQEHGDGRRRSQRQSRETTDTDKLRYSSTKVLKPNANNQARISKRTKKQIENVLDFRENIATIPNLLTGCRIALTPVIGYLVLDESYSLACILFLVAGITDLLDGWIARNYTNQRSLLGSFLDPMADKLLVCVLFASLTWVHLIPVPLTLLVISRDVILVTASCYIRYISLPAGFTFAEYFNAKKSPVQIQPIFVSKLNTAVQLGLVTASLCAPVFSFVDHPAMHVLWYVTAGTTVASAIGYAFAKNTFKYIRRPRMKQ